MGISSERNWVQVHFYQKVVAFQGVSVTKLPSSIYWSKEEKKVVKFNQHSVQLSLAIQILPHTYKHRHKSEGVQTYLELDISETNFLYLLIFQDYIYALKQISFDGKGRLWQ